MKKKLDEAKPMMNRLCDEPFSHIIHADESYKDETVKNTQSMENQKSISETKDVTILDTDGKSRDELLDLAINNPDKFKVQTNEMLRFMIGDKRFVNRKEDQPVSYIIRRNAETFQFALQTNPTISKAIEQLLKFFNTCPKYIEPPAPTGPVKQNYKIRVF